MTRSTGQRRHYSSDLLQRIVYQYYVLGRPCRKIAWDLDISLRVVQRSLQNWRKSGNVIKIRYGQRGIRRLVGDLLEYLLDLVERRPDIYLDEIQWRFRAHFCILVDLRTIASTLKYVGWSQKRLSPYASRRSDNDRASYKFVAGKEHQCTFVFTDESSVDIRTTYRLNGWARKGKRARVPLNFVRSKRWSVLPAISADGLVYSRIKEGSFDGAAFLDYVQGLLQFMNPYPGPRSVLVMDNCGIHHVPGVEDMCAERGVKLLYLPAYSPDFNPIEEGFSGFKSDGRRHGVEFRTALESQDPHDPIAFMNTMLDRVFTPKNCQGWFRHAGYH